MVAGELCSVGKSTQALPDAARAQGARHREGREIDSLPGFLSVCFIKAALAKPLAVWPSLARSRRSPALSLSGPPLPMQNRFVHLKLNQPPGSLFHTARTLCPTYQPTNVCGFSLQDFCHIFLEDFHIQGTKSQMGLCWEYLSSFKAVAVELEQLEMKKWHWQWKSDCLPLAKGVTLQQTWRTGIKSSSAPIYGDVQIFR